MKKQRFLKTSAIVLLICTMLPLPVLADPAPASPDEQETEPKSSSEEPLLNWEEEFGSEDPSHPLIALIDSGTSGEDAHIVGSASFVPSDGSGWEVAGPVEEDEGASDDNGHGSKMAAIIEAEDPDARILSIKAFGADGNSGAVSLCDGIQYAMDQQAQIINISAYGPCTEQNRAAEAMVRKASGQGILVIGSAGNEGESAENYIPGNISEICVVGSADPNGRIRDFSNRGKTVDYYVTSDSTSEAAARLTGFVSANYASWQAKLAETVDKTGWIWSPNTALETGKSEENEAKNKEKESADAERKTGQQSENKDKGGSTELTGNVDQKEKAGKHENVDQSKTGDDSGKIGKGGKGEKPESNSLQLNAPQQAMRRQMANAGAVQSQPVTVKDLDEVMKSNDYQYAVEGDLLSVSKAKFSSNGTFKDSFRQTASFSKDEQLDAAGWIPAGSPAIVLDTDALWNSDNAGNQDTGSSEKTGSQNAGSSEQIKDSDTDNSGKTEELNTDSSEETESGDEDWNWDEDPEDDPPLDEEENVRREKQHIDGSFSLTWTDVVWTEDPNEMAGLRLTFSDISIYRNGSEIDDSRGDGGRYVFLVADDGDGCAQLAAEPSGYGVRMTVRAEVLDHDGRKVKSGTMLWGFTDIDSPGITDLFPSDSSTEESDSDTYSDEENTETETNVGQTSDSPDEWHVGPRMTSADGTLESGYQECVTLLQGVKDDTVYIDQTGQHKHDKTSKAAELKINTYEGHPSLWSSASSYSYADFWDAGFAVLAKAPMFEYQWSGNDCGNMIASPHGAYPSNPTAPTIRQRVSVENGEKKDVIWLDPGKTGDSGDMEIYEDHINLELTGRPGGYYLDQAEISETYPAGLTVMSLELIEKDKNGKVISTDNFDLVHAQQGSSGLLKETEDYTATAKMVKGAVGDETSIRVKVKEPDHKMGRSFSVVCRIRASEPQTRELYLLNKRNKKKNAGAETGGDAAKKSDDSKTKKSGSTNTENSGAASTQNNGARSTESTQLSDQEKISILANGRGSDINKLNELKICCWSHGAKFEGAVRREGDAIGGNGGGTRTWYGDQALNDHSVTIAYELPQMSTTLTNQSQKELQGSHFVLRRRNAKESADDEKVTLNDAVAFQGLKRNTRYLVTGELMRYENGTLTGTGIKVEQNFSTDAASDAKVTTNAATANVAGSESAEGSGSSKGTSKKTNTGSAKTQDSVTENKRKTVDGKWNIQFQFVIPKWLANQSLIAMEQVYELGNDADGTRRLVLDEQTEMGEMENEKQRKQEEDRQTISIVATEPEKWVGKPAESEGGKPASIQFSKHENESYGEIQTWAVTTTIPIGICDTKKHYDKIKGGDSFCVMQMVDPLAPGLDFKENITVDILDESGKSIKAIPEKDSQSNGKSKSKEDNNLSNYVGEVTQKKVKDGSSVQVLQVKIMYNGLSYLARKEYEGKAKLRICFDTCMNEKAEPGEKIENQACIQWREYDPIAKIDGSNKTSRTYSLTDYTDKAYVDTGSIQILKTDGQVNNAGGGNPLPGSSFEIFREDPMVHEKVVFHMASNGGKTEGSAEDSVQQTKKANSEKTDGMTVWRGLADGTYYIREVKAPEGHELSRADIKVKVSNCHVTEVNGKPAADDGIVRIADSAVIPLFTGGPGRAWLLLISLGTSGAAFLLLFLGRRQFRRSVW